ncbi:MAG TPA: globin domain-containing protein [Flavitalea sp.]|nr:globin domain-containing protein [Flavitalea sp.]
MTNLQIEMVKGSWSSVAALDPILVGDIFYKQLFQLCPEVKPMFRHNLTEQSKKLLYMLSYIVNKLNRIDDILHEVKNLARRHVKYGVKRYHYDAVGAALLFTLERGLDKYWTKDLAEAWTACYTLLSSVMIDASVYSEENVLS